MKQQEDREGFYPIRNEEVRGNLMGGEGWGVFMCVRGGKGGGFVGILNYARSCSQK